MIFSTHMFNQMPNYFATQTNLSQIVVVIAIICFFASVHIKFVQCTHTWPQSIQKPNKNWYSCAISPSLFNTELSATLRFGLGIKLGLNVGIRIREKARVNNPNLLLHILTVFITDGSVIGTWPVCTLSVHSPSFFKCARILILKLLSF